jgi:hypothetical protein
VDSQPTDAVAEAKTDAGPTDTGTAAETADAGAWTGGFAATMFGNHTSGDCNGLANFSDTTNIAQANCVGDGTVTLATYSSGVANNAAYYGAPGDLSSIWAGGECTCQPPNQASTATCPSAPSCATEQDCGKCFEIKCDPNGTSTYSNGDTRNGASYCNASQGVVIQVIDACPHNHPSNTWWCTSKSPQHIDLSCSALEAIASTPSSVGSWGWLDVQVRPISCSVGLGPVAL